METMNDSHTTDSKIQNPHSPLRTPKSHSRHPILHEDAWMVAIHKPEGVLSHPNPSPRAKSTGHAERCAFEGRYDFDARRFDSSAGPIWLVHRLDQDTSGVLLGAKSEKVAGAFRSLFEKHQIQKTYIALVAGKPSPVSGFWKDHLQKETARGMVRSISLPRRPANAELSYAVLFTFPIPQALPKTEKNPRHHPKSAFHSLSLLKISLITGRTHQIRVQASRQRHFVTGDRIYGDFYLNKALRTTLGLRRLFLHAASLRFVHPETHQPVLLETPLPPDLEGVLGRLRTGVKKT